MCMTKAELEKKVEEIRKYKAMAEEASNIQKALEQEVISYMNELGLTEEFTDSAKITYKEQTRATLDKKRLEEDLGDLTEYENVTSYKVLRIKQESIINRARVEQSTRHPTKQEVYTMKSYTTYEEPLKGRTFTEKQMYKVYRDMADKKEYPDFKGWLADMVKSGVFEEV